MSNNLAYQDDHITKRREELIDGKVIAMSPRPNVNHTWISDNITLIFKNYLKGKKCVPFSDGVDLYLDEKNRFVPDFMVICDRDKIKPDGVHGAPDLVAEILSPSTAKNDKWNKKNAYESSGVPEYWIVSPAGKSIEVYLLKDGQYTLNDVYTFYSAEELEYMSAEEKAGLVTEFKCHLYNDLVIQLDDIFGDLF